MADLQLIALPVATSANDDDLLLMRQGDTDKQVTKEILFAQHLKASNNLSDIGDAAEARDNLDVAGIDEVLLKVNNLSDLASPSSARQNLDLEIGVDVQAYSAELAALATVGSTGTPGYIVQTGTNTVAVRTITQPAAGITVSNPTGAAGNTVLALANDLAALEALNSQGFATRIASDSWAIRTLTAPAAGFAINNPAGIADNPTFVLSDDLAALEALASTGYAVRTAADTWAVRTFQAGSTKTSITNPAGIAGNTAIDAVEANFNLNNLGGTLAINKGGTGQVTKAAAFNALSPNSTQGDITVYQSGTNARFPKGSASYVLQVDQSASGLQYKAPESVGPFIFLGNFSGNALTGIQTLLSNNGITDIVSVEFILRVKVYMSVANGIARMQIASAGQPYKTSGYKWSGGYYGTSAGGSSGSAEIGIPLHAGITLKGTGTSAYAFGEYRLGYGSGFDNAGNPNSLVCFGKFSALDSALILQSGNIGSVSQNDLGGTPHIDSIKFVASAGTITTVASLHAYRPV